MIAYRVAAEVLVRVIRIIIGVPIDAGLEVLAFFGALSAIRRWSRRREECSPFIFARIQWLMVGVAGLGVLAVCYAARTRVSAAWMVFIMAASLYCGCLMIGVGFVKLMAIRSLQLDERDPSRGMSYKQFSQRY